MLCRYIDPTTPQTYHSVMQRRGLQPEVVDLPHGTEGYWLGNKNAKNVIVYYHGTSTSKKTLLQLPSNLVAICAV